MRNKTMQQLRQRAVKMTLAVLVCGLVAACAAPRRSPAPVEDRGLARPGTVVAQPAPAMTVLPGAENAGKPGYYTVKPGDTLIRIALENGQNWRDIARWSELANPNVIEVGQVLRVVPPAPMAGTVVAQPIAPATGSAAAPLPPASAASAPRGPVATATPPGGTAVPAEEEIAWSWPTAGGAVLAGFDEQKNKGLDIGGRAGDAVVAAADGRVVYAGAGLRGYGNLIILKH
ncbi:MAG: LysM peptidoglycan-binding domain-containing protein, partial [Ramlibacter sp.]